MKRFFLTFFIGYIFLVSDSVAADSSRLPEIDCVGGLLISLPSKADVAATVFNQLFEVRETLYSEFDDGQPAFYSKYLYAGVIQITRALSAAEMSRYMDFSDVMREKARQLAEKNRKYGVDDPEGSYEESLLSDRAGFGARRFNYFYAVKNVGQHAFKWNATPTEARIPEFSAFMASLLKQVKSRQNFTLPEQAGLCMPYLFIPFDGRERYGHTIATTYRLQDHPDVTILLEDSTAKRPLESQDPAKLTASYKSNFFWTQDYRSYDSIKNLLTLRRYNPIDFAGQKGVESMVSMIRKDKVTQDYGYLVVTDGDPNAGTKKPELMLYVIRDAKTSEKRGMKPIGKVEFFKLAREIAASVKLRPSP